MTYFDTDVLVNAAIEQDPTKYIQANQIIEQTILSGKFQISWLSIQELGFVLAKLKEPKEVINVSLNQLISSLPVNYNKATFIRAIELANEIGFSDFNDCLHVAIAEEHCTELYTYNSRDFGRIQPLTTLTIHIL
jgi:predicted nucleic acid-binding protein